MHRPRRARSVAAPAAVLVLAVAPLLILPAGADTGSAAFWIVYLTAVYSAVRIVTSVLARGVLTLFFWLFWYVFFGLAAITQIAADAFPQVAQPDPSTVLRAAILNLLGAVFFDVGYVLASRRPVKLRQPSRELAPPRLFWLAVFGILATVYEISAHGGIGFLIGTRQGFAAAFAPQTNGLNVLTEVQDKTTIAINEALLDTPIFLAAYCLVLLSRSGRWREARAWGLPLLLLTGALAVFVNNPAVQPRQWAGTVFLGLLFAALGGRMTRRSLAVVAAAMLVGFVALFPLANKFRYEATSGITAAHANSGTSISSTLDSPDYDAFQEVAATFGYVERHGHTDGGQLLGAALFWVPRAVWPGKPVDAGSMVGMDLGYYSMGNTNLASPITAEGYIDGGTVLVAVELALIGWVFRRGDDFKQQPGTSLSPVGMMIPIFAVYELVVLRGPILPAMSKSCVIVLCLLLVTQRASQPAVGTRR